MLDFPLNQVIKSENGWTCNVFQLNYINTGGLFISEEDYEHMQVDPFKDQNYRFYQKTKKIVLSGSGDLNYNYCALNLRYTYWKCLLCKKLNKISEPNCYCSTYSNCWSPVDGVIVGCLFANNLSFPYHFEDTTLSNLIL